MEIDGISMGNPQKKLSKKPILKYYCPSMYLLRPKVYEGIPKK
jgi:hypothetical protein